MTTTNTKQTEPHSNSRWLFAGHSSAKSSEVAKVFEATYPGLVSSRDLDDESSNFSEIMDGFAAVALVISAQSGVSKSMIEFWNYINERQYPRIVIVTGLEFSESDFDDIVLIANRVLEPVTTPFLVLHDELGEPTGLISLSDMIVFDYSQKQMIQYPADTELQALVSEFKDEFDAQTEDFQTDGFISGLEVPAIPIVLNKEIGVAQVKKYLDLVFNA